MSWWFFLGGAAAAADPILREPETVVEVSTVSGLGDVPWYPEVGALEADEPELALARVGMAARSPCWPIGFAVRLDLAESLRLEREDFDRHPVAASGALVDDLYAVWAPRVWAELRLGRQPVPFSRYRQIDRMLLVGGTAPFLIDRIAPERRWGASFHGDLGAMAYAAGAYADGPRVEQRAADEDAADPSTGGRAALVAHVEWTPRAPIGRGSAPASPDDPWRPIARVSGGAGALVRLRDPERGTRTDLSVSGMAKWSRLATMAELVLSIDDERVALAAAGEVSLLVTDHALLFARGDHDIEIGWWTAGGGVSWMFTDDRRTALTLFGFARRTPGDELPDGDGVIAGLQASR